MLKMRKIETILLIGALIFVFVACSGSRARMIQTHVEEKHAGKPIQNVLIIAMMEDQEIRAILEKHYLDWLNVKGVEARTSHDVLPLDAATQLEKEAIIEVLQRYQNDTLLITRGVGFGVTEVFSRDRPHFFYDFNGYYNDAFGYIYWPTVTGEKVQLSIETRLYDLKTEALIWTGEFQLTNPKTTGQAIGQIVELVMQELEKNGLLPKPR